jgi:membrane-associated phospholipid phosphatase
MLRRRHRRSRSVRVWLGALLVLSTLAGGAAAQVDTIGAPKPLFTWRDGLLGMGFAGLTMAVAPIDKHFALRLQHPRAQENQFFRKTAVIVRTIADPGATIIGTSMYAIGRLSKDDRLADLGLHGTEAMGVGLLTAIVLKDVLGRERPHVNPKDPNPSNFQLFRGFRGGDKYRSFPSGHTTAGFAAAAAVTAETSRWWPEWSWLIGTTMYGGAALVGVSRMYDNRHWASDVIMGAAIGTFAGNKVVRYHHTHPGNRVDRWLLRASLVPKPEGGHALSFIALPVPGFLARQPTGSPPPPSSPPPR